MFQAKAKVRKREYVAVSLCLSVVLGGAVCLCAEESEKVSVPDGLEGVWDPAKYIGLDEVRPGMEAYCLTCYEGTKVEKFGVDVLSVVHNMSPGRDVILVKGTDERLIRTGPVGGCSGSPVYIEGRLAGAMAYAWTYSKDPLYGVTPIGEMLMVGRGTKTVGSGQSAGGMGYAFDLSKPIDLTEIERLLSTPHSTTWHRESGIERLPCPLIISGLPAEVCEGLDPLVEPLGLMAVSGLGGGTSGDLGEDVRLVPGAVLAVPLVAGDISMTVLGTVTEVRDDAVYGFGHSYLGYGAVDLPLATGQVHTVVSNVARSFKLGSALEIVGALTRDETAAVYGRIGAEAQMFPLTIRTERYNDTEPRVYNCRVAHNRLFTPSLVRSAITGAVLYLGDFPPDHTIKYKVAIGIRGSESIRFENISTGLGLVEMSADSISSVALLMNNPYERADIESIDVDVSVLAENVVSHIWSMSLSDYKVKAGEEIKIEAIVESVLAGKKKYQFSLEVPRELAPGKYELMVCGTQDYERFLRKAVPYRYIAQSMPSLIKALNDSLRIRRDRLYCLLAMPPGGIAVEGAELPDLPATKTLVLHSAKRTLRTQAYRPWLEETVDTGTVVIDKRVVPIIVERY
ncbi:MAG: hypothetical protein JSU70_14200 [Phycisphaerales bacterium]|nr:MAG: hypothetical protein JSU70_14200 [Phycisphaerales bacterium]